MNVNPQTLKPRYAMGVLSIVMLSSMSFFIGAAHATTTSTTVAPTPYQTGRYNAGTPNSTNSTTDANGTVTSYGNNAITYNSPPSTPQAIALGNALFQSNCASCHGTDASGVPEPGVPGAFPSLRGLGSATIDFWIESGRMPAANPRAVQALRKPPRLNHQQALEVAAWINSLSSTPGLPYIPSVNLRGGNVAVGASLFALNCAACHTITGDGDALAFSTYAPSLRHVPAVQVAEAIRTGPGNMPRFTGNLSDAQVRDIVKYVTGYIEHPKNPGGLGLGGLGPVAEGFIGLALGVGLLALAGFWVGERQ